MKTYGESTESKLASRNRIRALIFFTLAIVAGLAGVLLFMQYMGKLKGSFLEQSIQTVPVVTAKMDIPIATRLDERHLQIVQWPEKNVPVGSFRSIKELKGRTLRQSMIVGEVILRQRLADKGQGQGMAALLSAGQRAMSVKVDAVVGVAGFVKPGDFVDVITVMQPDQESEETLKLEAAKVSKIILQNIKVLAVGEHLETGGRKPVKVTVVTLAVAPEQSEKLALASLHGKIQLTMRSPIDLQESATVGSTPLMLLTPDEGAIVPEVRVAEVAVDENEKSENKTTRRKSNSSRKSRKVEEPVATPPARAPAVPVVEILRGSKVEQRKLHSAEGQQ